MSDRRRLAIRDSRGVVEIPFRKNGHQSVLIFSFLVVSSVFFDGLAVLTASLFCDSHCELSTGSETGANCFVLKYNDDVGAFIN